MIYVESDEIEWSTEANQLKLIKFNQALQDCEGCA